MDNRGSPALSNHQLGQATDELSEHKNHLGFEVKREKHDGENYKMGYPPVFFYRGRMTGETKFKRISRFQPLKWGWGLEDVYYRTI